MSRTQTPNPTPLRLTTLLTGTAAALLTLASLAGCESTPNRDDIRVDDQRTDEQRTDETLPTWKKQEKKWWEF
jgi:hypothetical protein